ncbi:MAG: M56 family metallopeptidase [Lachnospiraceae bacterium]|nr:M56 family metallopeptidase [Lachnospiraceae bacterium]
MYIWLFALLRNQALAAGVVVTASLLSRSKGPVASLQRKQVTWLLTGIFLFLPPLNSRRTAAFLFHFRESAVLRKALPLILALWLTVAFLLLTVSLIRHYLFIRKMKTFAEPADDALFTELRSCAARLHLKSVPPLYVSPEASGPFASGLFSPFIVIDRRDYSAEERQIILAHELLHIKRRDILYKSFLQFVKAVFWFNPAVRFMVNSAALDTECLCDNDVIRLLGREYCRPYAELLLKTQGASYAPETPGLKSPSGRRLKIRIENLFCTGNEKRRLLPAFLLICIFLSGNVLVAAAIDASASPGPDFLPPEAVWDTPEMAAASAWDKFYWEYTKDHVPSNIIPDGKAGPLWAAGYSVYDDTMAEELQEIAAHCHLRLHTDASPFERDPALYIGNLFSENEVTLSGFYFEDGSFYLSGFYSYCGEQFPVEIEKTVKGTLSEVSPALLCSRSWPALNMKTSEGILYSLILTPDEAPDGYLIVHTDEAIVTIRVKAGSRPVTKEMLINIAESLSVSIMIR